MLEGYQGAHHPPWKPGVPGSRTGRNSEKAAAGEHGQTATQSNGVLRPGSWCTVNGPRALGHPQWGGRLAEHKPCAPPKLSESGRTGVSRLGS